MLAFERAFAAGYGVETDLRDRDGVPVIAHDPAGPDNITFDAFLDLYFAGPARPALALNIKADGLTASVMETLNRRGVENYFVFDMSVPDTLHYLNAGLRTYTRRSEYEDASPLERRAQGVWLDSFEGAFISIDGIRDALSAVDEVAIVSPELHGRPHVETWRDWAPLLAAPLPAGRVLLCTDFPQEADAFFNRMDGAPV